MNENTKRKKKVVQRYAVRIKPLVGRGELYCRLLKDLERTLSSIDLPVVGTQDELLDKPVRYDELKKIAQSLGMYTGLARKLHHCIIGIKTKEEAENNPRYTSNRLALRLYNAEFPSLSGIGTIYYGERTRRLLQAYLESKELLEKQEEPQSS